MTNEKPHSADYFVDSRDHWWNPDFFELMARRWALNEVKSVLDVGCGQGHWTRTLAPHLHKDCQIVGVDAEKEWVDLAAELSQKSGISQRFSYTVGDALHLEYADNTFDMVTCQTVLIHLSDPSKAIAEFARVLKPGGLLAVVEPNNLVRSLCFDSMNFENPVEDVLALVRFQLLCERGKIRLGEGNNSLGDVVPGLFLKHGLADLQVYTSDKTDGYLPPYQGDEQRNAVREWEAWVQQDLWIWDKETTRRYFLGGGGLESEFGSLWGLAMAENQKTLAGLRAGTLSSAGGHMLFLVSGRKQVS